MAKIKSSFTSWPLDLFKVLKMQRFFPLHDDNDSNNNNNGSNDNDTGC